MAESKKKTERKRMHLIEVVCVCQMTAVSVFVKVGRLCVCVCVFLFLGEKNDSKNITRNLMKRVFVLYKLHVCFEKTKQNKNKKVHLNIICQEKKN